MKPQVIVIVGPTASGKTGLSIELAKKINGEIISSDSMQIYKDMNIGTAKPTVEEMQGIKHYMLDIVSPEEEFNVSKFKTLAENYIEEILSKGKVPIIVGGTGLYVNSLVYNINYGQVETDLEYRQELNEIADTEGLEILYKKLMNIDPESCKKISANDRKRIIRALEIYKVTNKTKTEQDIISRQNPIKYDYKIFGLEWDRQVLYERINKRVDIMLETGLIQEVQEVIRKYKNFPTAMQGIGYKEVIEYLDNIVTEQEMIDKLKMETRRYAKRQLTWFRANKDIVWINGETANVVEVIKNI